MDGPPRSFRKAAACLLAGATLYGTGCRSAHDATPRGPGAATPHVLDAPRRPWDWNGVIGTGQSLSVGAQASVASLTDQPFGNLKLSLGKADVTGPPYPVDDPTLSVVPLVEPIRPEATSFPSAYPSNIYGETPHTAMANEISALVEQERPEADARAGHTTVHTVVGESGQGMNIIDKAAVPTANTGHAYAATLFEVTALARLAAAAGKTYGISAIVLTHGETDSHNEAYESALIRLFDDYNADLRAITRQQEAIPMLLTQQQACPGDDTNPASILAEWKAGLDRPGEIVCAGPKYQYPYAPDRLHLTSTGYDQLGEKYGEVYYEKVVKGRDWQPLQPVSATLRGAVITVAFHVPSPPLAWDDGLPAPHHNGHAGWSKGRGFEVRNRNDELTIVSVAIDGASVAITLAGEPDPKDLVVRYAWTQDASGTHGGQGTGRIGQLRDSDPLVGYSTKTPQYNYALSFSMALTNR